MRGKRRGWMAPFQLFLFLNVIFFFAQSLSGLSVLAAPLDTHLHHMQYAPLAQRLVDSHPAARVRVWPVSVPLHPRPSSFLS